MEVTLSILEGSYDLAQTLVITQMFVICGVLLGSLICDLGCLVGILGWVLVKRSRRFLWQVVSTCLCVWVCGGGEGCLQGCWQENGEQGLGAAWGWAEGSQSISQAILSPLHPGGPPESQAYFLPSSFQLG